MFFVISGFLITSVILDDLAAGRFSLLGFYERRVRRIFPALFVVVLGMGEFFTERVIGGAQNPMLAGLILRQIDIFQWASASAIAVVLTTATLVTVSAMLRFFDLRRV